ncbi:hypothetical protein DFH27DRAFT_601184 [Peziza echinospora]|nr:hypothetical protein DFH27DRAFT_601184 [Peziza echinospora]
MHTSFFEVVMIFCFLEAYLPFDSVTSSQANSKASSTTISSNVPHSGSWVNLREFPETWAALHVSTSEGSDTPRARNLSFWPFPTFKTISKSKRVVRMPLFGTKKTTLKHKTGTQQPTPLAAPPAIKTKSERNATTPNRVPGETHIEGCSRRTKHKIVWLNPNDDPNKYLGREPVYMTIARRTAAGLVGPHPDLDPYRRAEAERRRRELSAWAREQEMKLLRKRWEKWEARPHTGTKIPLVGLGGRLVECSVPLARWLCEGPVLEYEAFGEEVEVRVGRELGSPGFPAPVPRALGPGEGMEREKKEDVLAWLGKQPAVYDWTVEEAVDGKEEEVRKGKRVGKEVKRKKKRRSKRHRKRE